MRPSHASSQRGSRWLVTREAEAVELQALGQVVVRAVESALRERRGGRRAVQEAPVEQLQRVGDVHDAVVVDVLRVRAARALDALEEAREE